jgi:hypothetical protein
VAAILALLALFFVANRGAYQSTFSDDDLDNISWTRTMPRSDFVSGFVSPWYFPNHFRPVGHFTYHLLANTAVLQFRYYVAAIHFLHLVNTALLWLLLRRLGLNGWQAWVGALCFVFNMAVFDALWKPMYLFDLWCTLFCLATLVFYVDGRTILALIAFWFAYKSKEHAVALPAVLFAYEWLLGKRQWKRLLPFAAISVWFGVQGVVMNNREGADYTLKFSAAALVTTLAFYGPRVVSLPMLFLAPWIRDRRVLFGLAAAVLMIGPMFFLPTRLSGAYLCATMIGVAVAIACVLAKFPWWASLAFFAAWIPLEYQQMRNDRRAALTTAYENRAYLSAAVNLPDQAPGVRRFIYDGFPPNLRWWGIQGALRVLQEPDIEMFSVEDKNLAAFQQGDVALLKWDQPPACIHRREALARRAGLELHPHGRHDPNLAARRRLVSARTSIAGSSRTRARYRPAGAREFTIEVNIGSGFIAAVKSPGSGYSSTTRKPVRASSQRRAGRHCGALPDSAPRHSPC